MDGSPVGPTPPTPTTPSPLDVAPEVVEVLLPQLPPQGLLELLLLHEVRKVRLPCVSTLRVVVEPFGRPFGSP